MYINVCETTHVLNFDDGKGGSQPRTLETECLERVSDTA